MAQPGLAMPRKSEGDAPLTIAQRQTRLRQRKIMTAKSWQLALERIRTVKTVREAREIADTALKPQKKESINAE